MAGELTRASGLGEGSRLMLLALKRLGVPCWSLDIGHLLPAHRDDLPALVPVEPPAGAAIVLHVNAPLLPMVLLRLPYPMGFYAKGIDGRIDDANGGWKGRGLWVSSGDRAPWQTEGGKGNRPMAVHFQIRPDPLAK